VPAFPAASVAYGRTGTGRGTMRPAMPSGSIRTSTAESAFAAGAPPAARSPEPFPADLPSSSLRGANGVGSPDRRTAT
jgi:hypothetical protein